MSYRLVTAIAVVAAYGLSACTSVEQESEVEVVDDRLTVVSPFGDDEATFSGTVPCASCPGIEMMIRLRPDQTFLLESVYLEAANGGDRAIGDMGRWSVTLGNRMLILRGGTEGARRFQIVSADTLLMLSNTGEEIVSELPYHLVRVDNKEWAAGDIRMAGMYQYMADAALFTDCRTRMRYPVVMEEAHIDLETAYLAKREEPGEPLFASFTGRLEMRPQMEGDGEREFVIVSSFDRIVSDRGCYDDELQITGSVWKLTELNGRPVGVDDPTRVPNLVLISEDSTAAGSGGCNRFTGGFHLTADSLVFDTMASTMMACPDGMDLEQRFLSALADASTYDLYGDMLEIATGGRLLARFEGTRVED